MKPVTKDVVAADSIAVMPTALDNTSPVMTMGVQVTIITVIHYVATHTTT